MFGLGRFDSWSRRDLSFGGSKVGADQLGWRYFETTTVDSHDQSQRDFKDVVVCIVTYRKIGIQCYHDSFVPC